MTSRLPFISVLSFLTFLTVGCAPATGIPESPSTPPAETGISAESAKEQGVYAADGDAQLVIDSYVTKNTEVLVKVTVTNISDVDEDYAVVLLSHDRTVGTTDVTVAAGTSVGLDISSKSRTVTHVRLDGTLLGEGISLLPVS